MDYRVKIFVREVAYRFGFLIDKYGFTTSDVWDDYRPRHPVMISVAYTRGDITIETALVLAYGGDEYVTTTLVTHQAAAPGQVAQLGEDTARTGYQMRSALDRHADAIRAALNRNA